MEKQLNLELGEMDHLQDVANEDVRCLMEKNKSYGGSWKRRGGVGAFMMLARKWDRLENMMVDDYDIFKAIASCHKDNQGKDGTALAEVRDLRRYLLLVEAEMVARGVVWSVSPLEPNRPGTPEDGGHHDGDDDEQNMNPPMPRPPRR